MTKLFSVQWQGFTGRWHTVRRDAPDGKPRMPRFQAALLAKAIVDANPKGSVRVRVVQAQKG